MIRLIPTEPTGLDNAMTDILNQMKDVSADSDEYARMADQLTKLHALKVNERPVRMSRDTLATILTNLAGIFMIIRHEQVNVVTSKALSFVTKTKN